MVDTARIAVDWDNAHAIDALLYAHEDDPASEYRLLADDLPETGITASENRVDRLCKIAGITGCRSRKRPGGAAPGPAVHDDLLAHEDEHGVTRHRFVADAPNQVRLTDISEHSTGEGRL